MRSNLTFVRTTSLSRSAGILTVAVALFFSIRTGAAFHEPDVVRIDPGVFTYRIAGEFTQASRPINAPLVKTRRDYPLVIMRTQVSAADFDLCVADGSCRSRDATAKRADLPATGVSWHDAADYAKWLSAKTGQRWRLPTDEEWSYAAGSRFKNDAITVAGADFSTRQLAKYDREDRSERATARALRPFGAFGANEHGILDMAGNVWEWTDTCFVRQTLDVAGRPSEVPTVNCGVRVVAGEHRSYIADFIRDPKSGGCSIGTPPTHLGFRLVRDDQPAQVSQLSRLLMRVRDVAAILPGSLWSQWKGDQQGQRQKR
jgi:formylglycine-generating enzyme required for sulfatase activity